MNQLRMCTNGRAGWAAVGSLGVMIALVAGAFASWEVSKPGTNPTKATTGKPASFLRLSGDEGGIAGTCPASQCVGGDCTLTQSLDTVTDAGNQVACGVAGVGTTANGWARCYNLAAEGVPAGNFTVDSVTFGVQQATMDGINIDVVLYLDTDGCPPTNVGVDAVVLCRESTVVNMADVGTLITVPFPGGPVVPSGSDLIVEIISVDDGTVVPEFQFRAMSNGPLPGQCGPSYIRTPEGDCGLGGWTDLAAIGFPDAHLVQIVNGTVGGTAAVCGNGIVEGCEECDPPDGVNCSPDCLLCGGPVICVPEACGPGAGACDQPNGTPGCEDEECCAEVCALPGQFCCTLGWDAGCVELAIGVGCVAGPCIPPKGDDGVPVPSSEDFDSYANGMPLNGVNGWTGWADDPGAIANVTNVQFRSAPNSVEIDGVDDAVQEYVGAYCEGQWTFTIWQYVPSSMTGISYFILLNTYDGTTNNWSTQVSFDATTGLVISEFDSEQLPLITDQWVQIRVEIDLDFDMDNQKFYYGGQLLHDKSWTAGVSGDGDPWIRAVDLWSNSASGLFYDDVSLDVAGKNTCPWDLNGDLSVGILDLLSLLTAWGTDPGGPPDFDGDGNVGILDLLALLTNWGPCP